MLIQARPVIASAPFAGSGQNGNRNNEWRSYGAVEGSTRYSALDQITRENVKSLQVAWTWRFDNYGSSTETLTTETTPIMAALSGAAVGAAAGALTGSLVGLGIPEVHATLYEGKINEGKLLIAVHTEDSDQVDRAKAVLTSRGAEDVTVTREASVPEKKPVERNANLR